jgi:hypothetical protein
MPKYHDKALQAATSNCACARLWVRNVGRRPILGNLRLQPPPFSVRPYRPGVDDVTVAARGGTRGSGVTSDESSPRAAEGSALEWAAERQVLSVTTLH